MDFATTQLLYPKKQNSSLYDKELFVSLWIVKGIKLNDENRA